jgi:hypothetical protein
MTRRFSQWLVFASWLCVPLAAVTLADTPADWVGDLSPISAADWTYERAAHLIQRAGFGATPEEIERLARLTPQQAVDLLVDYTAMDNSAAKPFEESGVWDRGMDPFPPSRADAVRQAREHGEALGVRALPDGSPRRLQPVVEKFFTLRANHRDTTLGVVANRMLTRIVHSRRS